MHSVVQAIAKWFWFAHDGIEVAFELKQYAFDQPIPLRPDEKCLRGHCFCCHWSCCEQRLPVDESPTLE